MRADDRHVGEGVVIDGRIRPPFSHDARETAQRLLDPRFPVARQPPEVDVGVPLPDRLEDLVDAALGSAAVPPTAYEMGVIRGPSLTVLVPLAGRKAVSPRERSRRRR
jgi:hypothetical protein